MISYIFIKTLTNLSIFYGDTITACMWPLQKCKKYELSKILTFLVIDCLNPTLCNHFIAVKK